MNNDKVLKEKLNSLDTLSTGIVFGKEEAWDKLQARMDRPAKRIVLKPWLAAAAVLLLLATVITAYYNAPEEQKIAKQVQHPIMDAPKSPAFPLPVVQVTENNIPEIRTAVREKKHERPVTHEQEKEMIPTERIPMEEPAPVRVPVDEVLVISNNTPAVPQKIPVKVVHINELNEDTNLHENLVSMEKRPTFDLKRLSVVHLNDIIRDDRIIQVIKKENSNGMGLLYFKKPGFHYNNMTETVNKNTISNPLQITINIQN